MAVITERVPLYRLPTALGGAANPIAATTAQFEALLQYGQLVTELKVHSTYDSCIAHGMHAYSR
jgi:hypothetical protein